MGLQRYDTFIYGIPFRKSLSSSHLFLPFQICVSSYLYLSIWLAFARVKPNKLLKHRKNSLRFFSLSSAPISEQRSYLYEKAKSAGVGSAFDYDFDFFFLLSY